MIGLGPVVRAHGFAVDRGNHVACAQAGVIRRAAGRYAEDIHTLDRPLVFVATDGDAAYLFSIRALRSSLPGEQ